MITLSRGKDSFIVNTRHPWIFRNAIKRAEDISNGDITPVSDSNGNIIGYGFYSSESKIACRMISFRETPLEDDWIRRKIIESYRLRESMKINSNAFRVINAEGDFFPGLVVDLYNTDWVVRPLISGTEKIIATVQDVLLELAPGKNVFLKRDERAARVEKLEMQTGYIEGSGEGTVYINENGIEYCVDIREGQKTGFYLDQRENRALFGKQAAGKSVMNLFCYTGGFSLCALAGGAEKVVSVDSSKHALAIAKISAERNPGLEMDRLSWVESDVFDYLPKANKYDLVMCDPPPFARSRGELSNAVSGYVKLNKMALSCINPGGLLFTFSCSQVVTRETFRQIIFRASREALRETRILQELSSPPDHAVSAYHPEGDYLKGLILYVG
ncbi:MAG: class I SAM-dependent rRNA methyltransferase [Spirochaetaceae bacterium]|nr:MAG: class I SAM-dependent rRNA methyltransferase [Spirochaetaceae bacterium]